MREWRVRSMIPVDDEELESGCAPDADRMMVTMTAMLFIDSTHMHAFAG